MPDFHVTAPDGRALTLTGDRPPTEAELDDIFSKVPKAPVPAHGPTEKSLTTRAAEWVPTVMGAGYGMASKVPVLGTGLAFLGGAGGEGYRQAIEGGRRLAGYAPEGDLPDSLMGQLEAMGREGAVQAGSEAAGRGIGAAVGKAGGALYRKLLKPSISARLAPRAAETVETGLEYGINPHSPRSLGRIEPEISRLGNEVEQIVSPGAAGAPLPRSPLPIANRVTKTAERYAAAGADPLDREAARRVPQQFLDDLTSATTQHVPVPSGAVDAGGRPLTTQVTTKQLQMMTGKAILEARRAAGKSAGPNSFGITRGAETDARKELYHELGSELKDMYPEVTGRMNLERRLIDLKDAATAAAERAKNAGGPMAARHIVPAALGLGYGASSGDTTGAAKYWLAAEMAGNPRLLTRAALMMHGAGGPAGQATLAQLLRASMLLGRGESEPSEGGP